MEEYGTETSNVFCIFIILWVEIAEPCDPFPFLSRRLLVSFLYKCLFGSSVTGARERERRELVTDIIFVLKLIKFGNIIISVSAVYLCSITLKVTRTPNG